MGDRDESLGVERAQLEEVNGHWDLELRATDCRGVWDQSDERAIRISGRNADNEGRPNLSDVAEVHEPDLAAESLLHLLRLAAVEFEKDLLSGTDERIVRRRPVRLREGRREKCRKHLFPLRFRKGLELLDQMGGSFGHDEILTSRQLTISSSAASVASPLQRVVSWRSYAGSEGVRVPRSRPSTLRSSSISGQ